MTSHTLSFCILEDLNPSFGPVHITLSDLSKNELHMKICSLINQFKTNEYADPSGYFDKEFFNNKEYCIDNIVNGLQIHKYFVRNRYGKYYVIAFAIDYMRFEIFSKDCDKELTKWRDDDQTDPVDKSIQNEDHNENLIVTCMKCLGL